MQLGAPSSRRKLLFARDVNLTAERNEGKVFERESQRNRKTSTKNEVARPSQKATRYAK